MKQKWGWIIFVVLVSLSLSMPVFASAHSYQVSIEELNDLNFSDINDNVTSAKPGISYDFGTITSDHFLNEDDISDIVGAQYTYLDTFIFNSDYKDQLDPLFGCIYLSKSDTDFNKHINGKDLVAGKNIIYGYYVVASDLDMTKDVKVILKYKFTIMINPSKEKQPRRILRREREYMEQIEDILSKHEKEGTWVYELFSFGPGVELTKQDFAYFLQEYFKFNNTVTEMPYTDMDEAYAKDQILALYQAGIFEATEDKVFGLDEKLTNAETLSIIHKCICAKHGGYLDVTQSEKEKEREIMDTINVEMSEEDKDRAAIILGLGYGEECYPLDENATRLGALNAIQWADMVLKLDYMDAYYVN